jgi:hypothetical protein
VSAPLYLHAVWPYFNRRPAALPGSSPTLGAVDRRGAWGSASQERREFVGRGEELAAVSGCAAEALAGRSTVVYIEGEAGSGKTGLVRAVLHELPPIFRVLLAEADELASEVVLDVIRQLGPVTTPEGFGAGLELLEAFDTAQDHGPLAVVVEDLHWADEVSRQALLTVARRLRHDKVVLLVTARPEVRGDGWERFVSDPDRCLHIKLGSLSVSDVGELARYRGVRLERAATASPHAGARAVCADAPG